MNDLKKRYDIWRFLREKDEISTSIPFLCKSVIFVLLIGFAIRIVLGLLMTHGYDMYHWGIIIENIKSGNGLYEITGYFYTPPWGYILGIISFFQDLFGVDIIGERMTGAIPIEDIAWFFTGTVTTPIFNISVKIFFFICDLLIGYIIFAFIRERTRDRRKAILGFTLWFLCPAVIAVGSIGGMFDTISALMTLLCIVFLLKGRYIESGIMFSMAVMTKFFPVFLLFIIIAYIFAKHRGDGSAVKKAVHFVLSAAIVTIILFIPQIIDGTFVDCFSFLTSRTDSGLGSSWGLFERYSLLLFYILALVGSLFLAIGLYRKGKDTLDDGFLISVMIIIAFLFIYPSLPQYLLLLLPFLVLAIMQDRRYLTPWIIISISSAIYAATAWPADLLSIAAFTDWIDLNSVVSLMIDYQGEFLGRPIMDWIYSFCKAGQLTGLLMIFWIRFGRSIRNTSRIYLDGTSSDSPK